MRTCSLAMGMRRLLLHFAVDFSTMNNATFWSIVFIQFPTPIAP